MRLVIAVCSVDYRGRLDTHLPAATRLIMIKQDGCVAVHGDGGAYKPLSWMNAPSRLVAEPGSWVVTNGRGERLEITLHEVLSDTTHDLGTDPGPVRDGVRYLDFLNRHAHTTPCRGILVATSFAPRAVTVAASRGIKCVSVDYDELRGVTPDDLSLF